MNIKDLLNGDDNASYRVEAPATVSVETSNTNDSSARPKPQPALSAGVGGNIAGLSRFPSTSEPTTATASYATSTQGNGAGIWKSGVTVPSARQSSKWTVDKDAELRRLRREGMKWGQISDKMPGRRAISCRLHYQNYLEPRSKEAGKDKENGKMGE